MLPRESVTLAGVAIGHIFGGDVLRVKRQGHLPVQNVR